MGKRYTSGHEAKSCKNTMLILSSANIDSNSSRNTIQTCSKQKIITKQFHTIEQGTLIWCCQTLTLTISTNKNFDLTCFQVFNNFLQNVLFSCNFHYLNGKAQRISYGSSVTYTEMEIKIRTSVFRAHNNY